MLLAATGIVGSPSTTSETPGWVGFENGRITEVGTGEAPRASESLGDVVLAPGLIDLQINGIDELDFGAVDADAAAIALDRIALTGCTSCCPTLVTGPDAAYGPALDAIAGARHVQGAGIRSAVIGVHLEGPFIGGAPGAHPLEHVRPANLSQLQSWVGRHRDLVRIVTIAPEADPDFAATRWLLDHGIVVAIGHTAADYDTVVAMIDAGASLVTHLFNGMSGLHHRAPGTVGAALHDRRVTASVIADGVHVHPVALSIAAAAKRGLALVTDAVAARAGHAGGVRLHESADGAARLADGTLAGSTLTMGEAVRNCVRAGIDLDRALTMATSIPAAVVGMTDRGRLEPGMRADLVAIDRATLTIEGVWVAGTRIR
jgi:N-acetylglucosamine-6-phosphate deacetylase